MEIFKNKVFNKNADLGLLILRISVGGLMLLHGISKVINGIDGIKFLTNKAGLPELFAYGVYVGEVVVPIFIILGLRSRIAALIFAFNCFVAAMLAHSSQIFSLSSTGGWEVELLGLYFFGALAIVFAGGGKYALSNRSKWD